ncbi:hypothetical protein EDB81DRAFT_845368 [Dactylonectria macrodidyma]|uniref:Trichothecene 3-O-acetyltransferase-like N-terminal domain-containing protein n=1 Tax=Dactylonectria macrodidyma TaxID=307937 RepID=A0A9P9E8R4_9HYPO|nr:hypothetical protein EDB81DRAFT_845368 [Dactylonectria macrodidyma]
MAEKIHDTAMDDPGSSEGKQGTAGEAEADNALFQDVMSQFPALNGHTQLVLGFQLAPGTSREGVADAIQEAVSKLASKIPWIDGQVVEENGIRRPAAWPADGPRNRMVRTKDCDNLVPPMAELLQKGIPVTNLDAKVVSPFPGLSEGYKIVPPVPIIALQANFIRGGLLLTMCFHHIVMDGTAVIQFIRLLALVMDGGQIPISDVEQANRDRSLVVPLLARGEPVKDYNELRRPPGFVYPTVESTPTWCYFKLPVAAMKALMKLASSQSPGFLLSENDVLCAFCWQRISAARLLRGSTSASTSSIHKHTPETISKFSRAIDGRLAVGIPLNYMGHMVYHAAVRLPLKRLVSSSLATIAQALRQELNAVNNEWTVRSYATFIAREPDKSKLLYGGRTNPNTDLGATSTLAGDGDWPHVFGPLLGRCCFLRRPYMSPITGSISISPVEKDFIPIGLCLPQADLEALKSDSEWKKYTRVIG